MQKVFVIDSNYKPCMPCHPSRARELLNKGKAAVYKHYPFTIVLKQECDSIIYSPIRIKIDPGSKATGIVLVENNEVIFAMNLLHRGHSIKESLDSRRSLRRGRRTRNLRYRPARFMNRTASKPKGWIAPSIKSRVDNITNWIIKLSKLCNITDCSYELVKFDMQLMQNPEISGVEYQQGELQGYEVREYLLEKWNRTCAYCKAKDVPLEIEHIIPKSRGGTNRVSNLTLACNKCNTKKGTKTATEFGFPEVQKNANKPLKDASAINIIRWHIYNNLKKVFTDIETGSGALTKMNRVKHNLPKDHWIDAACVGQSGSGIIVDTNQQFLEAKATGRGNRQMCKTDKYGFPNTASKSYRRTKLGVQTGDIIKLYNKKDNKYYTGRCILKNTTSAYLQVKENDKKVSKSAQDTQINILQKVDGYSYKLQSIGATSNG